MKKTIVIHFYVLMAVLFLAGCAAQPVATEPSGSQADLIGQSGSQSDTVSTEEIALPAKEPKQWTYAEYEQVEETEYTFEASDGRRIFGYQWLPQSAETPKGGFPTIILSHGYSSRSRNMKVDAFYFVKRGFACFAFDFCGGNVYQQSDGDFADMTVDTEIDDLNEIWNHVLSKDFVDKENVFLWGSSFGGVVTFLTVAQRDLNPKGVILEYPAFDMAEFAFQGKNGWSHSGEKFMEAAKAYYGRMEDYYRNFGLPTLILHGDKDTVVDLSFSEHATEYLPNARLEIIEGGGHTFNWEQNEAVVWPLIFEFLVGLYS